MPFALLKTWKFWAILIPFIGVIAGGYFAVKKFSDTLSENVQLKEDVRVAEAEKKALEEHSKGINEALSRQSQSTKTIIEKHNVIERQIQEMPKDNTAISRQVKMVLDAISIIDETNSDTVRPSD